MHEVEGLIREGFERVYPGLVEDWPELCKRLRRRRHATLLRPVRASCLVLRADDTRLEEVEAVEGRVGVRPDLDVFHGDWAERERWIVAQRRSGVWGAVEKIRMTGEVVERLAALVAVPYAMDARKAGELLGVHPVSVRLRSKEVREEDRLRTLEAGKRVGKRETNPPVLFQTKDHRGEIGIVPWNKRGVEHARAMGWPSLDCEEAKVWARGRRRVGHRALKDGTRFDPGCKRIGEGIDPEFAGLWASVRARVAAEFEQVLTRRRSDMRRVRRGREEECANGWVWACPKCGRRTRALYLPMPFKTLMEKWGVKVWQPRGEAQDRLVAEPEFACHRCHRVNFVRPHLYGTGWNLLVGQLTGGVLYGCEVERPGWMKVGPKKKVRRARLETIQKLRSEGKGWEEIGAEMGIKGESVRGMWKTCLREGGGGMAGAKKKARGEGAPTGRTIREREG